MDIHKKAKQEVLKELIEMLKGKEIDELKSKSSRFKPQAELLVVEPELEGDDETSEEDDALFPEEDVEIPEMESKEESEEDDEDMERLREMYARLK